MDRPFRREPPPMGHPEEAGTIPVFEIYRVHYFRKPTQHPPKKPKVGNMWEIPLFPNPLRKAKCCHFCSTMPVCAQAGWCALGVKCAARSRTEVRRVDSSETRPKRRRTRSHSRPISTPTTSKTVVYQPTVTKQHNPSRWIAGDSVTRYRYTLTVHTSTRRVNYSGRGIYK